MYLLTCAHANSTGFKIASDVILTNLGAVKALVFYTDFQNTYNIKMYILCCSIYSW